MKVLLLEADEAGASVVRYRLLADGHEVHWYRSLAEVPRPLDASYEVLLVALQLPDGSALEWIASLRSHGVETPALMLTEDNPPHVMPQGTRAWVRPSDVALLLREGLKPAHGATRQRHVYGAVELDFVAKKARHNGIYRRLTDRELEILIALTRHPGQLVPKHELESQAQSGIEGGSNAVEVHVSNLRRKLGRNFIETVRGLGYRIAV